jgi:hypothetical protein
MNEIYLVLHSNGSYDAYQEFPIKAFSKIEKSKEFVDAMYLRKLRWEANSQKQMQMDQEWLTANPYLTIRRGYPKPLPSFPGPRKSWTAEQKEELKQTQNWNKKVEREISEQTRAWNTAYMAKQEEFLLGLSQKEKDDLSSFNSDSNWSIEPIPYEE